MGGVRPAPRFALRRQLGDFVFRDRHWIAALNGTCFVSGSSVRKLIKKITANSNQFEFTKSILRDLSKGAREMLEVEPGSDASKDATCEFGVSGRVGISK